MQMTFRWFGDEKDTVSLAQIRQIPGVTGVVPALHKLPCGEPWPLDQILEMKKEIEDAGLTMECIESVNVHEDINWIWYIFPQIKGLGHSDMAAKYAIQNIGEATEYYNNSVLGTRLEELVKITNQIEGKSAEQMFREIDDNSNGYAMPGWETERMGEIKELFEKYKGITAEDLWTNLQYFLEKIIPVCEECDVKMAIHPDDPPWDIFGLPRIIRDLDSLKRFLKLVDSPYNGLTFCTGSLGASPDNDLPAMIREVGDRIYFAHIRNVKIEDHHFHETAHLSAAGSLDIYEIVRALQDVGFDGYIRPDHGRMIWGEVARPGYGLFDRALGAAYIGGVWEACEKSRHSKD